MLLIGLCVFANLFIIYNLIFNAFGDNQELFAREKVSGNLFVMLWFICILSDFSVKILFRQSSIIMNEYLCARPVLRNDWCGFLCLKELLSIWTLSCPLLFAPVLFYIMPVGSAILCLGSLYSGSMVNSVLAMTIRGTEEWRHKSFAATAWLVYAAISTFIMATSFSTGTLHHQYIYILFNGFCLFALYKYLALLHVYGEGKDTARDSVSEKERNAFPSLDYGILVRTRIFGWVFFCYMPLFAFCASATAFT